MKTTRLLTFVLVAAAVLVGGLSVAAPAEAATPCWKRLINDWYDGRIDKTYPARCYRQAIEQLPEDVAAYSSAREDIERALLAAARKAGGKLGPNAPIAPGPGRSGGPKGGGGTTTTPTSTSPTETTGGGGDDDEQAAPPLPGSDDAGGSGGIADALSPSNADSIPIPLLILGALALLLLAAAGASLVARKLQARRGLEGGPPLP